TPLVYPTSTAEPVCLAVRPSVGPAPAAAAPQPLCLTAGPRHTRPACAPVRAPRRVLRGLSPVAARRSPGSRRPRLHTQPPLGADRAGGRPTSVGSDGGTARWHR